MTERDQPLLTPPTAAAEVAPRKCSVIVRADQSDQPTVEELLNRLDQQRGVELIDVVLVESSLEGKGLHFETFEWLRHKRLPRKEFSYGRALNLGCAIAEGEYLVTLNGHTIPIGTSWLLDLTAPLQDSEVAGVCGLQNATWPNSRALKQTVLTGSNFGPPSWRGLATTNLAFLKKTWQRFPFDETVDFAEDKEWGRRVVRANQSIVLGAEATIHHAHPERTRRHALERHYQTARTEARFALTAQPSLSVFLLATATKLARAPLQGLTATAWKCLTAWYQLRGFISGSRIRAAGRSKATK